MFHSGIRTIRDGEPGRLFHSGIRTIRGGEPRKDVPLWDGPRKESLVSVSCPVRWTVIGEVMGMSGGSLGGRLVRGRVLTRRG